MVYKVLKTAHGSRCTVSARTKILLFSVLSLSILYIASKSKSESQCDSGSISCNLKAEAQISTAIKYSTNLTTSVADEIQDTSSKDAAQAMYELVAVFA